MPITSTPVAMGSRVPACPTFRVPASRRIRPTTSWLVHPCGLSTITSPESTLTSIWVARIAPMPELAAHVRDVPVNQIREITEAAWRTPGALVLSIGEPGFALPRHVLDAGMACLDRDETNYTPNAGLPALREAFAARFREEQGVDVGVDRVYVVSGAQQGLHFAMSLLLSPSDEILIPNPGYPTFAMTSRLLNAVPVGYPLHPDHGFQPRVADVEAPITTRTRALVLNSPSNPLGAVLGEELVRELMALARRHDIWVISDE